MRVRSKRGGSFLAAAGAFPRMGGVNVKGLSIHPSI